MLDRERILAKLDEELRNILVHEYGRVDDRLVYAMVSSGVQDFLGFQTEILSVLRKLER